jgi:alkanesulfonate monooxygenase SsuD/methylene tetrahydromethanopterin reductase-like flavin-dependent oxidoreductase (luciferase family)
VPAYAAFHDWLGRGERLRVMHERWAAGDRTSAAAAVPDDVVDDLVVHGSPAGCRARVRAYADAGVTTPLLALLPTPDGPPSLDLLRALAPER